MPLVGDCARICEGIIAEATGNPEAALALYRSALPGLERAEAHMFAHAARYRVGKLIGGDEGAQLCAEVHGWLKREGVRAPDRMLEMMLPAPRRT